MKYCEFATMSLEIKEKNNVFMGYFWDLASDDADKRVNAGRLIIGKHYINHTHCINHYIINNAFPLC